MTNRIKTLMLTAIATLFIAGLAQAGTVHCAVGQGRCNLNSPVWPEGKIRPHFNMQKCLEAAKKSYSATEAQAVCNDERVGA
jgi:hypothetical protein